MVTKPAKVQKNPTVLVGFSRGVPLKSFALNPPDESCSTIFGIPNGCVSKLRNLQICRRLYI